MDSAVFSALVPNTSVRIRSCIADTLTSFGDPMLSFVADAGVTIRPLREGERFDCASPALKRLRVNVDAWPLPPAGLFVVEERAVYLRSRSPMTIAHEFAHAIDCALGGGIYRSGTDPAIRAAFENASAFVTPYAGTGIDEYFAECVRAFVNVNDPLSPWPRATRERLQRVDSAMSEIVEHIFTHVRS